MLILAMEGEKKQEKKRLEGIETPKRVSNPRRRVIGSSSTWRQKELDKFMVNVEEKGAKEMIPEKWFNFGELENHQFGNFQR